MAGKAGKGWIFIGIAISLISIGVTVFALSYLSNQIRPVDQELADLRTSLAHQTAEMNRAELIHNQFTILNHLSKLASDQKRKAASDDSIFMLQSFLDRIYIVANDVPLTEVIRSANEENAEALAFLARLKSATQSGNTADIERAIREGEEFSKKVSGPKTELGRRMNGSALVADPEKLAYKDTQEIVNEISPYLKTLNDQFLASFQQKETRIKELEAKRLDLTEWTQIAAYVAIGLQLLGLTIVLASNRTSSVSNTEPHPEKAGKNGLQLLSLSESEATDSLSGREPQGQNRIGRQSQSHEARDLLAELEEEVRSAIDHVSRTIEMPRVEPRVDDRKS